MTDKIKVKVEVEVAVDPDWIDFLLNHNDIFMTSYCGYWMSGMELDENGGGWLVHEQDDDYDCAAAAANHPEYNAIVKAWQDGKPLPDKWFRLDKEAAIRAWIEGCKKYGVDWYENSDAVSMDVVIQLALLGEVRYG